MTRSFKWHLQFPLNFPFSLLAENWFCVMATLNFWLTFFPTTVCSSGRQLSQFTPVSRDYSSITAVDSRWACSHLSTKPAVLTNTKKTSHCQASCVDQHEQTNKHTNISLTSQLCWKNTNKQRQTHTSLYQASSVDKVATSRGKLHVADVTSAISGSPGFTPRPLPIQAQAHKHTSTQAQAHKHIV